MAQCCPELRRLEVAGCYNVSNEAVFEVVSRCPNLEHLDVSGNSFRVILSKNMLFLSCVRCIGNNIIDIWVKQ